MKKDVYILRSVPGAGKTTIAEELCDNKYSSHICSSDDFLTNLETGEYVWTEEQVFLAHKWCEKTFEEQLIDNTEIIVVANTNVKHKDVKFYRNLAIEYGYRVFVMVIENWHNGVDTHDVSDEIKKKMASTIQTNIKLI